MELADVLDSKSSGSDTVPVRPRSAAPKKARRSDTEVSAARLFLAAKNEPAAGNPAAGFGYLRVMAFHTDS